MSDEAGVKAVFHVLHAAASLLPHELLSKLVTEPSWPNKPLGVEAGATQDQNSKRLRRLSFVVKTPTQHTIGLMINYLIIQKVSFFRRFI